MEGASVRATQGEHHAETSHIQFDRQGGRQYVGDDVISASWRRDLTTHGHLYHHEKPVQIPRQRHRPKRKTMNKIANAGPGVPTFQSMNGQSRQENFYALHRPPTASADQHQRDDAQTVGVEPACVQMLVRQESFFSSIGKALCGFIACCTGRDKEPQPEFLSYRHIGNNVFEQMSREDAAANQRETDKYMARLRAETAIARSGREKFGLTLMSFTSETTSRKDAEVCRVSLESDNIASDGELSASSSGSDTPSWNGNKTYRQKAGHVPAWSFAQAMPSGQPVYAPSSRRRTPSAGME